MMALQHLAEAMDAEREMIARITDPETPVIAGTEEEMRARWLREEEEQKVALAEMRALHEKLDNCG